MATFLINWLPSQTLGSHIPIQLLTKHFLDFHVSSDLKPKVFGCVSFVHIPTVSRGKLDPRALRCIFIGYSSTQKGYLCYHLPTKKYFVSADVTFIENDSYFGSPHSLGQSSSSIDKNQPPILPDHDLSSFTLPSTIPKDSLGMTSKEPVLDTPWPL